jgi:spore germination cell wall hydrolase CwlJ-like protein
MLMTTGAVASGLSKETRCLAQNIYFEARGESDFGQLAVGLVTMNRVHSRKYPSSICRVVWQRRQFSWTHDGKSDRPVDRAAWKKAIKIAKHIHENYSLMRERNLDYTKGALHYYAPDLANPYWAKRKVATLKVGGHVFVVADNKS